jgi:hypothetical protein
MSPLMRYWTYCTLCLFWLVVREYSVLPNLSLETFQGRRQQQAEEWKSAWGQARIFVYVDRHGELNLHFMAKKAR